MCTIVHKRDPKKHEISRCCSPAPVFFLRGPVRLLGQHGILSLLCLGGPGVVLQDPRKLRAWWVKFLSFWGHFLVIFVKKPNCTVNAPESPRGGPQGQEDKGPTQPRGFWFPAFRRSTGSKNNQNFVFFRGFSKQKRIFSRHSNREFVQYLIILIAKSIYSQ